MTNVSSEALIPRLLSRFERKFLFESISFLSGVLLISALTQVAILLPWTPVPITGQTFGVALVALSWGRKRAFSIFLGYLALGSLGAPVFALGQSGFLVGPTMGYLIGMLVASLVVGGLADFGFTKTFARSLLAAFVGSLITFSFGLWGLSFFIGDGLLMAGLFPFIPGDILKNTLAATLSWKLRNRA